ncbi:MAG: carbamoyltransferase [Phycisphaerae bacterium]|nr:carbamoyltransferase [Phycisphaerae bacterium]
MSRLVLGLNSHHPDASAVLMNEKGVVAAIAEERINRKKHCSGFPGLAIQEVLRIAGASLSDVTDVSIARDPRANLGAKLRFIARNPSIGLALAKVRFSKHKKAMSEAENLAETMGVKEALVKARFHKVEHHLAHVASSFFWSGFDRATAVTVDGSGDFATAMIAECRGTTINILKRCYLPESLGLYYSAVCNFLGFNKYGEEYKVMGLSAYGQDKFRDQMRVLVGYDPAHGIRLNQDYFLYYSSKFGAGGHENVHAMIKDGEILLPKMWSDRFIELFGPPRKRGEPLTQRDKDMSCSMQKAFEDAYAALMTDAVRRAGGCKDAVLAGGCALNGVANGKVLQEKIFDRVYIQPAAGDDGTAAGAASYVLHSVLGVPRVPEVQHAYWGTSWTDEQIEPDTKGIPAGYTVRKLDRATLMRTAADSLAKGKILGWFQGREEWGPRALGNRSILCNPGWPDMKAILNARVKNREPFRPFAPAILEERLNDCFDGAHPVPFMNIIFKVRPQWRQQLSATTHEDATGRVQTVRRDQNDMYYDLISAFCERTGTPVLLNTSFNENEPIVHTPRQAVDCFVRTRMDALAVGSYWIEKPADVADKGEAV